MAGRSRGRNSRFHYNNPRNEHDDRGSRPSTSRGGGYLDHNSIYKKVTFKSNNRGGNHYRKSWENKTDLVREQLDGEFSNRNGPGRNNPGRRSYPERNNSRRLGNNKYKGSYMLSHSPTGWYSVFVPNIEYPEEVIKFIQTYISPVVFFPYNKQYFDNALRFLVDDFQIAKTLHNTSYKITLKDDRKLIIKVCAYLPPRTPISFLPVSTEITDKMIEAMASRYNAGTKSLDLSKFYTCPLFTENQMFVSLNRPAVLLSALKIVAQHTKNDLYGLSLSENHIYLGEGLIWIRRLFPELKVLDLSGNKFSDFKELKSLFGFSIEVLQLSRNPLCNTDDKEKYKRDVQQYFPMLIKLDDLDLPTQYNTIARSKLKMPINLDNFYPIPEGHNPQLPNPLVPLVESFLTEFYNRYDNDVSRQIVAEAYHQNASFTLSAVCNTHQKKGNLSQYLQESRNFLKSDTNRRGRNRFLHKGKENVVNFLTKLPKTKHDLGSFVVDVPFAKSEMIQIVVNGVFAENFTSSDKRHLFRSFCRTFCIVPFNEGWSIISDMLFVTTITDEILLESSKRFTVQKLIAVSKKNSNTSNNNSDSNNTMFVEDNDEMGGIESSFQPDYASPPPYQPTAFHAYQPSISVNPQQPPPYPSSSQMSTMQNQSANFQNYPAPIAAATLQSDSQLLNTSLSPGLNTAKFPTSSSLASVPNNTLTGGVSFNSIGAANANSDNEKLAMVKSFSNESGMNDVWTKKCLEDNGWDYAQAALCFSKLKHTIPPVAFAKNT